MARLKLGSKRWQIGVAVIGVLAAIGVLTAMSLGPSTTTYYYTVDEFAALGPKAAGQFVQVNGMLQPGFQWSPDQLQLKFTLAGQSGGHVVNVVYNGPEPNPFEPGVTSVVVAGRLGADGVFSATQLMVKCPSRYSAAQSTS
ncbi:MAG TPA: cytochrome c maturation protein CcmE [Bacillota bacterium]|nr:cytochrome c maturation protein CcmE [Bacillota bacterium]